MTREELEDQLEQAVAGFSSIEGVTDELSDRLVGETFVVRHLSVIEPEDLMQMGELTRGRPTRSSPSPSEGDRRGESGGSGTSPPARQQRWKNLPERRARRGGRASSRNASESAPGPTGERTMPEAVPQPQDPPQESQT